MTGAQPLADFTVAVFSSGNELTLVCLEDDLDESAAVEAAARGQSYAGHIAVSSGSPRVQIEPGFAVTMAYAGVVFAEMLGPRLKQHQLKQREGR